MVQLQVQENNKKWVQVRVELTGKLVSIIGQEWFDRIDVTLSSRPLVDDNVTQPFSALHQTVRYLDSMEFGPYQNIGEADYETAVGPATAHMKTVISDFTDHYEEAIRRGKFHFVYCDDNDDFSIIITVNEG